jgi:hypothetical protein
VYLDGVVLGCGIACGALGLVVTHGAYFGSKIAEFAASAKAESAEEAKSFAGHRRALGRNYLRISWSAG